MSQKFMNFHLSLVQKKIHQKRLIRILLFTLPLLNVIIFNPLNVHYVSVGICQRDKDSRTGVKGRKDTDRYGDLDFEPPGFVKIFMFFMSRADI